MMEFVSFLRGKSKPPQSGYKDLNNFFCFWREKKLLLDALSHSDLTGMLIQGLLDFAMKEALFSDQKLARENRILQEHMVRFCVCGMMMMVLTWHKNGYKESVEQMTEVAVRLLTKPLVTEEQLHL